MADDKKPGTKAETKAAEASALPPEEKQNLTPAKVAGATEFEEKAAPKPPEAAPAVVRVAKTKPYRMRAGAVNHAGAKPGDIVQLTEQQAAAFRDKFEPVSGEAIVNESRFKGEAKDEQGSAHGTQREKLAPAAPAVPPPVQAADTPRPAPSK